MAAFDTLKNWWFNMTSAAATATQTISGAVYGAGGMIDSTPREMRHVLNYCASQATMQRMVVEARNFHDGKQGTMLTDRLREFMGSGDTATARRGQTLSGQASVQLNLVRKINTQIAQRLIVDKFDCESADESESNRQADFAAAIWAGSRMKGKRAALMTALARDGQAFLLIDEDAETQRERWTPHAIYTDASVSGNGEGCFMAYPNDDTDQKPLYAAKRWTEILRNGDGSTTPQQRCTIYCEEIIQRFALTAIGWQLADLALPGGVVLPREEWNTEDATEGGEPLGIPMVHVKTPGLRPLAHDAIGPQKAVNKTFIDMLTASDMAAFRVLIALGFVPTSDGTTTGDPLRIEAGTWVYTERENAKVQEIQGDDPTRFVEMINAQISMMSDVSGVPLSMLVKSGSVRAEGTLQEEKEEFFSLLRDVQETSSLAFEDALHISRRRWNVFFATAGEVLDESPAFAVVWSPLNSRTVADRAADSAAMQAAGFPTAAVWADAWGKTSDEIEAMQAEKASETATREAEAALRLTVWKAANEAQKAGVSADQTLKEAGYSPEQIDAMDAEQMARALSDTAVIPSAAR